VVPLIARQRAFGVLHLLFETAAHLSLLEEAFLPRAASLLGTELQRRRREEEHLRLETQFLHAQKMEAVGRLAGGVAHDFNNILTAITSYSELGLLKLEAAHPLRRNFEEILAAADRAALLTQQLLAFSRRQILTPRLIDLNVVITDLGKMLRRLLGEDVEIVVKADPALSAVFADPAQIEQVLVNLAVNSRDAMPRGGKIVIETSNTHLDESYAAGHPEVVPGDHVCLSVSDNGGGMSEEVRQRIFEPFFTTKEQRTGSGLGLAAVYGVIRQSGGHVQVYSEPGVGTTFRIYFPAADGDASCLVRPSRMAEVPHGTETILLAEDDDSVRAVIVEHLGDLGYTVIETRDGRQAIEAARRVAQVDLLLTDVIMPGMSGRELAAQLAADRPGLRVLYVSGYTDEAIVQHGILEPGTEFLQKPFSPGALGCRVRQILDARRAGDGA
jgi:signal transduction histidine kinase